MKLVLHNYWRSSASYRVRIGLALKGLAYEYVSVHLVKDGGQQHAEGYRALNPMAQVPTLQVVEDAGHTIALTQSLPILEYLDERWPHHRLLPDGLEPPEMAARARLRALAELCNSGVQPLHNLGVLGAVKALGGDERAWAQRFIAHGLAAYEASVAAEPGPFSVGARPTLADCCLIPQLYAARRFGVDLEPFPRLRAIDAACAAHPAFVAAHPDRQPDAVPA